MIVKCLMVLSISLPCFCQRPFYAGKKPIGYPEIITTEPNMVHGKLRPNLPPQLKGDEGYANTLSNLPEDQQPFWYLNQEKYKEYMQNPQTYEPSPNYFIDSNNH